MNNKTIEDIITCGICFEVFNEGSRCPRMSSCGHTFCHSCLEKILKQNPLCPKCKTSIQSPKAELIPINFSVKDMISVVKHPKEASDNSLPNRVPSPNPLKMESDGSCAEHSNSKELRCMDCNIWICAMCGVLRHKQCRLLLIEEAYKELKVQIDQKIVRELDSNKEIHENIRKFLENLEKEKKELNNEIKKKEFNLKICEKRIVELLSLKSEDIRFCETLKEQRKEAEEPSYSFEYTIALSILEELMVRRKMISSYLETLYDHWPWSIPNTTEELGKLCSTFPVYAVDDEKDFLFGMVKMKQRQIRISSFHPQLPEGHFIHIAEILSRFTGSTSILKKCFLKLVPKGETDKEIDLVIETDGTSPRAKNFIILCSELTEQRYKGRTLVYRDSSFYELNPGPRTVVEGIRTEDDATTPWKEGFVVGMWEGNSAFYIALEGDDSEYSLIKFGEVVSGLQKLKEFRGKNLLIKESGLVI